jgi:DNA-binding NtrC family response regulator
VLAATNKDLPAEIRAGGSARSLFPPERRRPVPSLRDRQEDIPLLADHFMAMLARERASSEDNEPDAVSALQRYPWPGNAMRTVSAW